MGYDRGDSFPFDFEPNGTPFGSKSKGKLSPRSYPIQCDRKWKYSFFSVRDADSKYLLCRTERTVSMLLTREEIHCFKCSIQHINLVCRDLQF